MNPGKVTGLSLPFFIVLSIFAQGEIKLPKNTFGDRTASYFSAFNSQDEAAMRKYFAENIDPASIEKRPIDARMDFHRQLWADMGKIEIVKIVIAKENEISVTARSSKNEYFKFSFVYSETPPNKLAMFGVEPTEGVSETAQPVSPLSESEATRAIETYLNELAAKDAFSGTVLIAKGENSIFQKVYGLASKEFDAPNRPDTKFNLGSINKIFTQIAIAQLQAQGKISFDDPIG